MNSRDPSVTRRQILGTLGAVAASSAAPAWARGASIIGPSIRSGFDELRGPAVDLQIAHGSRTVAGRRGHAIAVNGSVPGPLIRLREGQDVTLNVLNLLDEDSSIHWHGLIVPFQFDGVPGVSFPGIGSKQRFTYRFPIRQSGTYWWHSHSGLQEQSGHYGPLVIDPAEPDGIPVDRDYVLLLSEFTTLHPHQIMKKLKTGEGYFNYQQTTLTDDYDLKGSDRRAWARMRMMATDILDVSGSTYTYLANGHAPDEGMEFLFRPGERVRLRIINGSAMSFFNVRLPGLPMTVIAADGQNVKPVEIDELQIGVAETYDVILQPGGADAYTIACEAMDRSGMAVATLTSRPGLRAAVPPLRDPPLLTMVDMGMDHSGMKHGAMGGGMAMGGATGMDHSKMDHSKMDHAKMGAAVPASPKKQNTSMAGMEKMPMRDTSLLPPDVAVGPGIDMVSMAPADRMGFPGLGLDTVPHRTLNYRKLAAREARPRPRVPTRFMEIHLTGNMERYMWSFDGKKFTAVTDDPIRFAYDERVRVKLVNDTMMAHPIHLHGHFFELVNGQGPGEQPFKHTVIVQPGGSAQFDLTADAPGDWAFHCHLLYHMHAGMMQVVSVAAPKDAA